MRRRWFSLRAFTFHLLLIIIVPGCLIAGWWQINRARQGNLLSYAYSVEWPVFAIIAVIGWWQLLREDPADVEARKVERARREAFRKVALSEDPSMWAIGLRRPSDGDPAVAELAGTEQAAIADMSSGAGDGEPTSSTLAPTVDDETTARNLEALQAYDLYLRRLALSNRPKTWRNPRGVPAPMAGAEEPVTAPAPRSVIDVREIAPEDDTPDGAAPG